MIVIHYHITLYQFFSSFFIIYILDHLLYQYFLTAVSFDLTRTHSYLSFLGEIILNKKIRMRTSDLSRQHVLAIFICGIRVFIDLTSE